MISLGEAINEVNNFRAKNQRLVEIFESEVEKEITNAAKKGRRNKEICDYCIWVGVENKFGARNLHHLHRGVEEIAVRDLRKKGFRVDTRHDGFEVFW